MSLTDRQQAVLDYLRQHVATHGRPPTLWEVAEAFGLASPTGVAKHLQALAEKGFIALEPGRARGIRLLGSNPQAGGMVLPILGRVAAGAPIGAAGELGDGLLVDPRLFKRAPDYLLRVQGQSMRDDGIFDGHGLGFWPWGPSSLARASSIQNLLPVRGDDSSPTRPPMRSTPFCTMARPMPVPA